MRLLGSGVAHGGNVPQGSKVARLGSAIRLHGVDHWYRSGRSQVQALIGIDLEIPAGGYLALTGPSGAGKSTLLSLIGGLERPQSGTLMVGQHNLRELHTDALAEYRRTTIGFVFQHFGLLDLLSARENIELAASLASASRNRRQQASDLLGEVGLLDRAEHRPGQLSGGERQRVAIARALVNDPGPDPGGRAYRKPGRRQCDARAQPPRAGAS
jgi:putative ABC transport system ATP-binding protein